MSYTVMNIGEQGPPDSWARPTVNDDLSIRWEPLDGDVLGPFPATAVIEAQYDDQAGEFQVLPAAGIKNRHVDIYITEARVVVVCKNFARGGGWIGTLDPVGLAGAAALNLGSHALAHHRARNSVLIGQVRFPWVSLIQFLENSDQAGGEIDLYFKDELGPTCYIQVDLAERTSPKYLALLLRERIIRYRIADRDPKTAEALDHLQRALEEVTPSKYEELDSLVDVSIPGDHFKAGFGCAEAPAFPPLSGRNSPTVVHREAVIENADKPREFHEMISTYRPSRGESDARLFRYPALDDEWRIKFTSTDGNVAGPITADVIVDRIVLSDPNSSIFDNKGRVMADEIGSIVDPGRIMLFVTDQRVAFLLHDNKSGKSWAGHIQYSWLSHVQFEPKRGWMGCERIRLFYRNANNPMPHLVDIDLNASVKAIGIASDIVRRCSSHRLSMSSSIPHATRTELETLSRTGQLAAPAKGSFATIVLPGNTPRG